MSNVVYLNGAWLPAAEARISIYDTGFLHGAGLFETMRADWGRVFRLTAHLDRLLDAATRLGLPITSADLPAAGTFDELLARNGLQTARVRLTVTAGSGLPANDGSGPPPLTVCVTATDLPAYPAELYAQGMTVGIAPYRQAPTDPLAGIKTLNYFPRILALRHAQQRRCGEALWFTTQNLLAEGCISNAFVVRGGTLATPPLDTPVLPGVTRAAILELAAEQALPAAEKPLTIDDVLDADELFLTNSNMQVVPVCRVERKDIGSGRPGPITGTLREVLQGLVRRECGGPE